MTRPFSFHVRFFPVVTPNAAHAGEDPISLRTTHRKNRPVRRSHHQGKNGLVRKRTYFSCAGRFRSSFRCAHARGWGFAGAPEKNIPHISHKVT